MLLRITLGLAILVGLGTIFISHFQVSPKIQEIITARDEFKTQKESAEADASKSRNETKVAKADLEKTRKEFGDATNMLAQVTVRATEQEKRASQASEALTRTTEERNEAQRDLAAWRALGLPVETIRNQRDELRKVAEQRDTFVEENRVLARNNNQLRAELDKFLDGEEREVKLPAGLKGKVVAVDPKFDFVVLDIGTNQGVLENGRLLINRNGRLIAKVRVTSVEPSRSIANIIPEWKQDEIMEGDQVLY